MFSGKSFETKSLVTICSPKQWETISVNEFKDTGYPVYGANGIIGYYNEYNHKEPTILITCRGATCGNINVTVGKAYVTGNAMCLDNLLIEINYKYLEMYLRNYDFSYIITGSAQPQITINGLKNVFVPIPPKYLQDEFADFVKEQDKLKFILEK